MTEEEAKKKTCPMVRHCINAHDVNAYQYPPIYEHPNCLGSECMAWRALPIASLRHARAELAEGRKIGAIKALREARPDYGLLEAKQVIEGERPWPTEESNGYCGLAGAPQ